MVQQRKRVETETTDEVVVVTMRDPNLVTEHRLERSGHPRKGVGTTRGRNLVTVEVRETWTPLRRTGRRLNSICY